MILTLHLSGTTKRKAKPFSFGVHRWPSVLRSVLCCVDLCTPPCHTSLCFFLVYFLFKPKKKKKKRKETTHTHSDTTTIADAQTRGLSSTISSPCGGEGTSKGKDDAFVNLGQCDWLLNYFLSFSSICIHKASCEFAANNINRNNSIVRYLGR